MSFLSDNRNELEVSFKKNISRRALLSRGTAVVASSLLEGQMAKAQSTGGDDGLKVYDVTTNGITLHVTEQGEGPAVLFCHGFPDTSYTWRRQMKAIASAGYRAIAPDMRGYGRSSAPADATLYTPLQTAGDLVRSLRCRVEQPTDPTHDSRKSPFSLLDTQFAAVELRIESQIG
jgi:hypothetical protein